MPKIIPPIDIPMHNSSNHDTFKRNEENRLEATECFFFALMCSTSFGHLYAHHQVLETILVL